MHTIQSFIQAINYSGECEMGSAVVVVVVGFYSEQQSLLFFLFACATR